SRRRAACPKRAFLAPAHISIGRQGIGHSVTVSNLWIEPWGSGGADRRGEWHDRRTRPQGFERSRGAGRAGGGGGGARPEEEGPAGRPAEAGPSRGAGRSP